MTLMLFLRYTFLKKTFQILVADSVNLFLNVRHERLLLIVIL